MGDVTASVSDVLAPSEPPRIVTPPPGPRSRARSAELVEVECPAFAERRKRRDPTSTHSPASIVLARGAGSNLFDVDDNRYVDLAAGFGAAILGHGPSAAHSAAAQQVSTLVQGLGDMLSSEIKVTLMQRLAGMFAPDAKVILGQSGADAVTAAIKTATLFTGKDGLLAFEGAYHGLSYAPLAACGFRASFREPFAAQLNPDVRFVPYPRRSEELAAILEQVNAALSSGSIGAILIEPVMGRGGVLVPAELETPLRQLATRHGALIISDEIWSGMGRSGRLIRSLSSGLAPDIVCLGKGLGASFPISACIATGRVMDAWARGGEVLHTSTHAGAPLGCAAALATLDAVDALGLCRRSELLGQRMLEALRESLAHHRSVVEVRGVGLMIGIELASGALGLRTLSRALDRGYLVTVGGRAAEVVILTPPLVIAERTLLDFVPVLAEILAP